MADRHECEWGPWHPWCAQYRCIYPGCYKNMPSDEVARRLNATERLSAKQAEDAATNSACHMHDRCVYKKEFKEVQDTIDALQAYADVRNL